jgi:hypothetical protein
MSQSSTFKDVFIKYLMLVDWDFALQFLRLLVGEFHSILNPVLLEQRFDLGYKSGRKQRLYGIGPYDQDTSSR